MGVKFVPSEPWRVLAIDPGKNIGWATGSNERWERGVMEWDEFFQQLVLDRDSSKLFFVPTGDPTIYDEVTEVVIENYRIDPGTPQGGREVVASEVIGAVRILCEIAGVPLVRQEPAILSTAMKHANYTPPVTKTGKKKHLPDQDSAWLHLVEYLIGQGLALVSDFD